MTNISAPLFFLGLASLVLMAQGSPCSDAAAKLENESDCVESDFKLYQECLKRNKEIRSKREVTCPYASQAQELVQPEIEYATPQRSYRNIRIAGNDSNQNWQSELPAGGSNITTVINLNNIINNTNIIDVPTNINSTNINNIHVYQNTSSGSGSKSGGKYGLGWSEDGPCCNAVEQKSCRKGGQGTRCHHHRHRTCGEQCKSKTIHVQLRRKCTGENGCARRRISIPQPKPQCVSIANWPYVSCGVNRERSCYGCYDHYGTGYDGYYHEEVDCEGCYDDGFSMGPLYRRGPVLRPNYYHEPPCYLTGRCRNYYSDSHGYWGHDRIDPGFGPEDYEDDDEFEAPDDHLLTSAEISDLNIGNEGSGTIDFEDTDFGIDGQKCHVVDKENNIDIIRNCTKEDLKNLWSTNPSTNDLDENEASVKRSPKRQAFIPLDEDIIDTSVIRKARKTSTLPEKESRKHFIIDDGDETFKDELGEYVLN